MPHYRIRRAGLEFPVCGLPALVQMVGDGVLTAEDRVWDPEQEQWRPASEIACLAPAFADREALRQRLSPPRAPVLSEPSPPSVEAQPFPDPPAEEEDPGDRPSESCPPLSFEPRGQVIRFPDPREGYSEGALAREPQDEPLDPALFRPAVEPFPPAPSSWHVRPMVLLTTLLLGGILLLAVQMHVRGTAGRYFQPVQTARTIPTVVPGVPPSTGAPNLPQGMADFYETMEDELRRRMVVGDFEIRSEDALEMALMVELSRLRIDLVRVSAPILTWGGRRGDVPMSAEIRIWYESQPADLDQELAAIGLAVGRYVQRYNLEVPACEILIQEPEGGIRARPLDPELARAFYLQRISLVKFLAGDEAL